MRSALVVSVVMGGLVACGGRVTQTGPQPTSPIQTSEVVGDTSAKSASLVRRLAEAADGFRDGKPRYVVAHRKGQQGHHKVLGVFRNPDQANFAARMGGDGYAVFGPFVTLDDPPDESSSPMDVVEVTIRQRDGVVKRYSADSVDAVFWSLAAFDKFIAPYLASVDGVRYAAEQRELYRIGKSPFANSQAIVHKAGSF